MSGKRIQISFAAVLAVWITAPLSAQPLFQTFAICTGRLSAELEHAWLVGAEDVDLTQDRRAQFISLLDATTPDDARQDALNLRIEAKVAHAQVLTQATFGTTQERQDWARKRAEYELRACSSMLLES